jgi:hypothetical protein
MRVDFRRAACGYLAILFLLVAMSGCAGVQTAIEHSNPEVVTSTSDALFLDVFESKNIFVKYRNASGYDAMDKVLDEVAKQLKEKGHNIVTDHEKADIIISATTLDADKVDKAASELKGNSNAGMVAGAAAGYTAGIQKGDPLAAVIGGIGGAAAGGLAEATVNSLVKVGTISMVTDVQVAEKVEGGVKTKTKSVIGQGGGSGDSQVKQVKEGTSEYMKYRMQAVTRVKQTNIEWKEVSDLFVDEVSRVIGGIV